MNLFLKEKNKSGQSLIEGVLAIFLVGIVLTAIGVALISSLDNSIFLDNQNMANKYAQQGIEYIRNLKLSDYQAFSAHANEECIQYNASKEITQISAPACTAPDTNTNFIHNATFTANGCDNNGITGTQVTVRVEWQSGKCPATDRYCHSSVMSTCFNNNIIDASGVPGF